MATKLQYATNPLASASSNNSFVVNQLSDWRGYPQEIGTRNHLQSHHLHHFKYSMNDMFDSQNIECIKKTMLMHEEIFKLQVKELHRLYDRQTNLMYELKNEMKHNRGHALTTKDTINPEFSVWHQPTQDIKPSLPIHGLKLDPQERSASCSGENPRMEKGFDLEKVDEEGPSTSIRCIEQDQKGHNHSLKLVNANNEMNFHGPDEEIDVELTLSIGCGSRKKRSNPYIRSSDPNSNEGEILPSSIIKRDKREDLGDPSPAVGSTRATLSQNVERSNWLF